LGKLFTILRKRATLFTVLAGRVGLFGKSALRGKASLSLKKQFFAGAATKFTIDVITVHGSLIWDSASCLTDTWYKSPQIIIAEMRESPLITKTNINKKATPFCKVALLLYGGIIFPSNN